MVVRRHTCSIHVDTNRWRDGATRIIFFRGCFSDFVEKFGSRETVNVEAHKSRGYLSLSLPFSDARHWFVNVDRVATIFDGNRHGQ